MSIWSLRERRHRVSVATPSHGMKGWRFIDGYQGRNLLRMAFNAGYETGAEDAGSGELLAEAQALQSEFYDLDGKTRRAVALDDLVMAVSVETIEHEKDCGCGLCRALGAVDV